MAFDLSWLWTTLQQIVSSIQSWFSNLWTVAQNITNTGQGIFSGLVAFGSQIWDAILKGIESFGEWLYDTFKWIYDGIVYWASVFGEWISYAFQWVGSGLNWIAQQVYNFGNWLYNGLVYIWNWIINAIKGVWNALMGVFSGIASAIGSWWGNIVNGVNAWITNLVVGIRRKITETIIADVSIYFGWKTVDRLINAKGLKDAGLSILGLLASPFVGYLFGNIVNGLIPTPSTEPIQLIPEIAPFTYTPPSLTVETPTEKPYPEVGTPPSAPARVTERGLPYDITTSITLTYNSTISSSDKTASISSTYEYEVT
jgi:hypothetical protein